jgi:hypothetical protein
MVARGVSDRALRAGQSTVGWYGIVEDDAELRSLTAALFEDDEGLLEEPDHGASAAETNRWTPSSAKAQRQRWGHC